MTVSPRARPRALHTEQPPLTATPHRDHSRQRYVLACVLVLLAAVAVLGFRGGGYLLQPTTPVVLVLGACAIAGVWLAPAVARPSGAYRVALLAFTGFVFWTGLSLLWSAGPDLSWVAFDLVALYLAAMAFLGVLPDGRLQLRLVTTGFLVIMLAIAVYALLGKLTPDVVTHAHVFARLSAPVGYWNVLAIMIAMAIPIAMVHASRVAWPWWLRGLASCALVLLLCTLFFTFSRGAYVALSAALIVYFVLAAGRRLSGLVSLAIPSVFVALALIEVRHLGTLFSPTADDALRTLQGHAMARWFLLALVLAFGAQSLAALAQRRWPLSARAARRAGIAIVVLLVLTPIVAGAVYFPRHGGFVPWVHSHWETAMSGSGPTNDVNRLTSLGSSGRIPWYREALQGFEQHIGTGTGAGTFAFTNYLYRDHSWVVRHSHSEWLNVLSELGLVGFGLFAITIGALMVAVFRRAWRDRDKPHRGLLVACQAAVVAFVVHLSLDWDWDMAAATLAFLLLAAAAAACAREAGHAVESEGLSSSASSRRPLLSTRVVITAALVLLMVSWALPYLSQRATQAGVDQMSRGQLAAAGASARRAARLDPLSVDPLVLLARSQALRGDRLGAQATLEKAVKLQPQNYAVYYQMGQLQNDSFHRHGIARLWFQAALALNPLDPLLREKVRESQP